MTTTDLTPAAVYGPARLPLTEVDRDVREAADWWAPVFTTRPAADAIGDDPEALPEVLRAARAAAERAELKQMPYARFAARSARLGVHVVEAAGAVGVVVCGAREIAP